MKFIFNPVINPHDTSGRSRKPQRCASSNVTFSLLIGVLLSAQVHSDDAPHPDNLPLLTVAPGVLLKELIGGSGVANARTERVSVAFFHLEPGRASHWSYTVVGEESFLVLKGHGVVWTGSRPHAVHAGSFILVPAGVVRSIRANADNILEFYAVTTPAWTSKDDVMTSAPENAPK